MYQQDIMRLYIASGQPGGGGNRSLLVIFVKAYGELNMILIANHWLTDALASLS